MMVITYVNSHVPFGTVLSGAQLFSFSQQIKRINSICIVNWMTFRTHTISNETSKNILNNIIEYFQSISIANQLLQKSIFIFIPSGIGNVLKIFAFLNKIFRK